MTRYAQSLVEWAVFLLFGAASVAILLLIPRDIIFDQGFITYSFSFAHYPVFDSGLTSNLLVGLYNLALHPPQHLLNAQIRIVAFLIYSASAYALARAVLDSSFSRVLFLAFLFTSRFYFLWLSSELFTGAFLCLSILLMMRSSMGERRCDPWAAASLCLAGMTKPDLCLTSLLLFALLVLSVRQASRRKLMVGVYFGLFFLLVLPGFWAEGFNFFQHDRGYSAFSQHYAAMIYAHQLAVNAPEPWTNSQYYMAKMFPGPELYRDIPFLHPQLYCDFIFLSLSTSFRNVLSVFGPLCAVVPIAYWTRSSRGSTRLSNFLSFSRATLIGLIPILLFAYLHVRYITRFYPIAILWALVYREKVNRSGLRSVAVNTIVFVALFWSAMTFHGDWQNLRTIFYWFPD